MSPTLLSCALAQRFVPEFEKRWRRYAPPVGTSWRVDETYINVRGRWSYLRRAVDEQGLTVDFLLSEHRDIAAAKRFFSRAIRLHGAPQSITMDGYPATHTAIAELKKGGVLRSETKVWTSKYLNNIIEQDHRRVKRRLYPMLGFKSLRNAVVTISGIELAQKIRKRQFNTSTVIVREGARVSQVWGAALAG
jgi:transposase-like protein